jgi:hypothetical protein
MRLNESGAALILNLLIMAIFAMTGAIVYAAAKSQAFAVVSDVRQMQAQAIAEAGLEDAMQNIYQNSTWTTGFTQKPFAGGYYTVLVTTGMGNSPIITSTGYSSGLSLSGRAVKTVVARVETVTGSCPYAVMAEHDISVDGKVDAYDAVHSLTPSTTDFTTGANVRSNGSVTMGGASCPPARILGDATAMSSLPSANCVSGSLITTTTTISVPSFDCPSCATTNDNLTGINPSSAYSGGASQKLTVNSGQVVNLSSGTYYFKQIQIDGTLNVSTSSGAAAIYLKNNFTSASGCQINNLSKIPSRMHFYGVNSGNVINLNCATPLHAYLEGSQSNFTLEQELYGHFCSDRVTISSTTGHVGLLHYDLGGGAVSSIRWTTGSGGSWGESYARP